MVYNFYYIYRNPASLYPIMQCFPICLAVAFDQNYATPFYVLATSIFQNSAASYQFHAIVSGLREEDKADIKSFIHQHHSVIYFYELQPGLLDNLTLPSWGPTTLATYYRFFFPELVPDTVTKLLYLDTDIVVVNDLSMLYAVDLGSYPAGAVPEINATLNRPDLGIYEAGTYFNSGVLLINVPEWKKQCISQKSTHLLRSLPEKLIWIDQDALNVVLKDNYLKLDGRFNVLPFDIPKDLRRKEYTAFLRDKVIIHYTLKHHKPWDIRSPSKFKYLYHYYLKKSPRSHEKKYTSIPLTAGTIKAMVKVKVLEAIINRPMMSALLKKLIGRDISNWLF